MVFSLYLPAKTPSEFISCAEVGEVGIRSECLVRLKFCRCGGVWDCKGYDRGRGLSGQVLKIPHRRRLEIHGHRIYMI